MTSVKSVTLVLQDIDDLHSNEAHGGWQGPSSTESLSPLQTLRTMRNGVWNNGTLQSGSTDISLLSQQAVDLLIMVSYLSLTHIRLPKAATPNKVTLPPKPPTVLR